jgi:hypothetical protein
MNKNGGQAWWLKPVILSTWEAEMGRSQFKASPGNKFVKPMAEHGGTHLSAQLHRKAQTEGS